jgi:hypothetical protein
MLDSGIAIWYISFVSKWLTQQVTRGYTTMKKVECTGTYNEKIDQYIVTENGTGIEVCRGFNRSNIKSYKLPKTHNVTKWVVNK